jgi:hypothetical protein
VSGVGDVHRHAAHGIDLLVPSSCRDRPCRGIELAGGAQAHDLGDDRDGDLFGADVAEIDAGGRMHAREPVVVDASIAQVPELGVGALRRRDESLVGRRRRERALEGVFVVVTLGRDDHEGTLVDVAEVERRQHDVGVVVADRSAVVDRERAPAEPAREPGQRERGRRPSDRHDLRLRQHGFHVDLQRAFALARDRHAHDALAPVRLELIGRTQEQQPRRALLDRVERLSDDGGLRARATDPPVDLPIWRDQGGRALFPGRGGAAPHHGREHVGPAPRRQGAGEPQHLRCHEPPCADWIASHTLALVSGMSMFFTPSGCRASITAFT